MAPSTSQFGLFTAALGLSPPWETLPVHLDPGAKRIDLEVGFVRGARFACPACGAAKQPVRDSRRRSWQHLHFLARHGHSRPVPRVRCGSSAEITQGAMPWARPGSGFTELFEAMVVTLCTQMPVQAVARHLCVDGDALWRILYHYVDATRAQEGFSELIAVGLGETAAHCAHRYIRVSCTLEHRRVLYACPGRNQHTVARFAEDLRAQCGDPEAVTVACIVISKAYVAGVGRHLPARAVQESGADDQGPLGRYHNAFDSRLHYGGTEGAGGRL